LTGRKIKTGKGERKIRRREVQREIIYGENKNRKIKAIILGIL